MLKSTQQLPVGTDAELNPLQDWEESFLSGPGQMGGAFPLDGSKQNMRQTSSHMGRDHQVSFHIFSGILGQELTLGIPNPISGMIIFIAKLTSVLSPLQDFERI